MTDPIVITGYDQISALGTSLSELDDALAEQRSGVTAFALDIPGLDPAQVAIARANWEVGKLIAPSKVPMDRGTAMALTVAQHAVAQATTHAGAIEPSGLGVYWGSGMAGAHTFDLTCEALYVHQRRIRPTNVVTVMPNAPAAEIALLLQAKGI